MKKLFPDGTSYVIEEKFKLINWRVIANTTFWLGILAGLCGLGGAGTCILAAIFFLLLDKTK